MNTASVSLAVTPTVVSTLLSHYLRRNPLPQKPTAHISYDEGLHLIRSFLSHASRHTVEELQAFTSQWVPHPQWVRVDEVDIPESELSRAASHIAEQLGPDGVRRVGGREWWQWRKKPLQAEWIEMKSDYHERKKNSDPGNRVMLYVHGGAYFFGSVDEHRYQIQRHARKLKARALAPRYRLAPQFPFPCGLQDCLATYLYLLTQQPSNTIVLAGDSAGSGMILSLLVILRDAGFPLPAGAVLISPWVDLAHSFPSVSGDCPLDYIPPSGFHHKPSVSWPPPDEDELDEMKKTATEQKVQLAAAGGVSNLSGETPTLRDIANTTHRLSLVIDGERVEIKEQIQMYTTNELLAHPLVSPVMQPTLGGLPPLLIMVGGGEMLRDEQIYLAHKCANPEKYLPPEALMDEHARAQLKEYKPTDVQLQVWDDLCHVAPTLSFTSPAKFMYRSVAQFSAWCLARAQKIDIDILDDDQISVISRSDSPAKHKWQERDKGKQKIAENQPDEQLSIKKAEVSIGKAGDPLPRFQDHMIRQRVSLHGAIFSLPPAEELPSCTVERDHIGVIKVGPVRKWLDHKRRWESRFRQSRTRIRKQRLQDMAIGYEIFGEGEVPPPSALAGRRKIGGAELEKKRQRGLGLSLWSLWGSKHDEMTVQREHEADKHPETKAATSAEGEGARTFSDLQRQEQASPSSKFASLVNLRRSHRKHVKDESQIEEDKREAAVRDSDNVPAMVVDDSAENQETFPETDETFPNIESGIGVTGKRMFIGGLATPFSLRKEAETASMITLMAPTDQASRPTTPGVNNILTADAVERGEEGSIVNDRIDEDDVDVLNQTGGSTPFATALATPGDRPVLERFVTASELPQTMP
ncbi:Alpha/Beta hydrolase protein [Lasiosphaeris hirsuta]|uniref:Alpha/Beta hydrolase protein n=1 Tax=Lasiosphaeris hirsuta TaxID=260670 RepID=A0AA40DLF8_9PEZI|nr:Alpha/Beta hydrolase protein [Lasiosphaeris hirsuta]